MICSVTVSEEENWYVATESTTGIASQGKSRDEALANIQEALELYYEDIPESMRVAHQNMFTKRRTIP